MKLEQITSLENYELVSRNFTENKTFTSVFTSDLLSDVVANAEEDSVLITIQAHKNTIAVASLVGIGVIIFCSGRKADEATLKAAENEKITIICTPDNQFDASCKAGKLLYSLQKEEE